MVDKALAFAEQEFQLLAGSLQIKKKEVNNENNFLRFGALQRDLEVIKMISNSVVLASACALQLFMAGSAGEQDSVLSQLVAAVLVPHVARRSCWFPLGFWLGPASRENILKAEYLEIKAAGVRHQPVGAGLTCCQPRALQGQEHHGAAPGWGQDYWEAKVRSLEADNAGVIFPVSHLHSS